MTGWITPIKRRIRTGLVNLARARGYEVTAQWKLHGQPLARHLRAVFARHGIDCVLDVGGNMGQYRDLLREDVGFAGWIVSFEPVRKYATLLQTRSAADPRWQVCDYALGRADGQASINVTRSPGLNSFLAPRHDVVEGFWSDDAISAVESVTIRTLDGVIDALRLRLGFERPYLKLDTQGFDLEVLAGAGRTLPDIDAVRGLGSLDLSRDAGLPRNDCPRRCCRFRSERHVRGQPRRGDAADRIRLRAAQSQARIGSLNCERPRLACRDQSRARQARSEVRS